MQKVNSYSCGINDNDNNPSSSEKSGSNTTAVTTAVTTTFNISSRAGWSRHNNYSNKDQRLLPLLFCKITTCNIQ